MQQSFSRFTHSCLQKVVCVLSMLSTSCLMFAIIILTERNQLARLGLCFWRVVGSFRQCRLCIIDFFLNNVWMERRRWGRGGCRLGLGLDIVHFLHKEYNRSYYDAGLNKANVPILRIFISSLQPAASPRPCCRHGGGRVWWRRGGGVTASARNNRYPATSGRTSSAELQLRTHSWHIVTHRDTSWPGSSHSSSHVGLVLWWSEKLCYSEELLFG